MSMNLPESAPEQLAIISAAAAIQTSKIKEATFDFERDKMVQGLHCEEDHYVFIAAARLFRVCHNGIPFGLHFGLNRINGDSDFLALCLLSDREAAEEAQQIWSSLSELDKERIQKVVNDKLCKR